MPTQFYIPNTKTEISISSTLAEMIESSKFRSASAIRKKPLKFKHARQVFTDLGDPKMYSWPQPEVVRLKMRGMPEICVS